MSRKQAFPLAVQVAEGLQAAHEAGIVHADFKSGNVILIQASGRERAVITDFGLARISPMAAPTDETRTLPAAGHVAGTVAYMSPEQLTGGEIGPASDIYSFGIVLFEMASGQLPFDDRHLIHSAMQRASDSVTVRPLVPDIDARWESAIRRCLHKDPERRFASARDIANWFRGGAFRMPHVYWTPQDWMRAMAAGVAVLALATWLWIYLRRPYQPLPAALAWYSKGLAAMGSMTYESARRALEQAVAADPKFALAHAHLARAYDELDYSDLAKTSMLHAQDASQGSRLSSSDALRLRVLRLWTTRDYDQAAPLAQQLEKQAGKQEKPAAALEAGWLEQQREETAKAEAAYRRALQLDPGYAAAKLRLGFILGRQRKLAPALQAFEEAESLYDAASDYEGRTEALLQKASLLSRSSSPAEATAIIEKAIEGARATRSLTQQLRLQLLQGVAYRNQGDTARAIELAEQAVEAARTQKMENIAISGLIDLGNIFLVREEPNLSERYFKQALDLAQRSKGPRSEARALLSLASLSDQMGRAGDTRKYVDLALPFYRKAGYRREFVQAMMLLGDVHRQQAGYEESIRVFRQTLASAEQLQDKRTLAQVRERLAIALWDQGAAPEALQESERAAELFGPSLLAGHVLLHSASVSWQLGRRIEAEASLAKVERLLGGRSNQPLMQFWLHTRRAEMAYADGRLEAARTAARQAVSVAPAHGTETPRAELLEALVLIRTSRGGRGGDLADKALQSFTQAGRVREAASARLLVAEALLAAGKLEPALSMAREALKFFEPLRIWESVWRGRLVAARASREPAEAEAHAAAARSALGQLRTSWPRESLEGYLGRPDIKQLIKGIQL